MFAYRMNRVGVRVTGHAGRNRGGLRLGRELRLILYAARREFVKESSQIPTARAFPQPRANAFTLF